MKKHLLIIGLMLVILTIGAVSASDDSDVLTVDDDAQGDSIQETPEDDEEILADSVIADYYNDVDVPEEITKYDNDGSYSNAQITVTLPNDAKGNITAYLDDDNDYCYNEAINKSIDSSNHSSNYINLGNKELSNGSHKILINYSGDSNYIGFQKEFNFNVISKYKWEMNITYPSSVIKGWDYYINIGNRPPNAHYIVYVDGKKYSDLSYWFSFDTEDLSFGSHEFTLVTVDDDNYYVIENKTGSFNVTSVGFRVDESIVYSRYAPDGEDGPTIACFGIYSAENTTGNVRLVIDGKDQDMVFINGDGQIYVDDLACGLHDYEMIYEGNCPTVSQKGKINVTYSMTPRIYGGAYGEKIGVDPGVPYDATGTLTLIIGDKFYNSTIMEGGYVDFDLPNFDVGEHNVTLIYNGDAKYNYPQSINKTFTITGYEIEMSDYNLKYYDIMHFGSDEYITLTLPTNATGSLKVIVDDNEYANVKLENGVAKVSLKNLTLGKHNLTAQYTGTDYSVDSLVKNDFDVKIFTDYHEWISLDEQGWISVILPNDAKGNITIIFDGNETTAVNVTASEIRNYTFDCKKLGSHYFTLNYTGDDYDIDFNNYWEYDDDGELVFNPFHVTPINIVEPDYGEGNELILTLPDDAKGNLTIYEANWDDDEVEIIAKINTSGSQAKFIFNNTGYYKYAYEDEKYGTYKDSCEVYPDSILNLADINITSDVKENTVVLNFELSNDANGSLIIKINDKFYYKELDNAKATLTINNLTKGDYVVDVTYSGNSKYSKSKSNATFIVNGINTDNNITIPEIIGGKSTNIPVNLPSDATGNVTLVVDGKAVDTKELVNGSAVLTVPNQNTGKHNISIIYSGDNQYEGFNKTTSIDVKSPSSSNITEKRIDTSITAKNAAYVINYGGTYSVTLNTKVAGKKVVLNINGKDYEATTNANGVASFKLTKAILKSAGVKTVTVKFDGDSTYNPSTPVTVNITVNKEKPKLSVAKKTYKKSKNKKVKITLKSSKNKPIKGTFKVTLKVTKKLKGSVGKKLKKGKVFKVKFNKKGIGYITLKAKQVKGFKKGTYKFTVTFKGNGVYKAVTKKNIKMKIK